MIFLRFPATFRRFSKIVQRLPKTFEEDPKMFPWYTNQFTYNLSDKLDITEIIDIFTCEDIVSFYQFVTTRYTTDFYINKKATVTSLLRSKNDIPSKFYTDFRRAF